MQIIRPEREAAATSLRFEVAPAYDLLISLAAAAQPDRYEMPSSWARRVRQTLPGSVRANLSLFFGGPISLGTGPIQLVPDLPTGGDAVAFLRGLEGLDTPDLVAAILGRRSDGRLVSAALRRGARGKGLQGDDERLLRSHAASLKAETRKRFWTILQDPQGMRDRYLQLVHAHHEGWFAVHYDEVLPFLALRAKQGRRWVGKLPTKEVIARVTGGFTLQAPARSVTLIPSYYASPFVFVVREGKDAVLVYGSRPSRMEGEVSPVGHQTVKVLKALADETRLRILQLLAQQPLYGQQIADALGLSHPTVSHHMAQLRLAGLTRTELAEDGSRTYIVQPEALEYLFAELRGTLLEDRPSGREAL